MTRINYGIAGRAFVRCGFRCGSFSNRAAKLYFTVVGNMAGQSSSNTLIQNQNNYIQINGTVLSQENIEQLTPDQLNVIESILKTALIPL